MENEEIEAPYRIISLSEIGPLVLKNGPNFTSVLNASEG